MVNRGGMLLKEEVWWYKRLESSGNYREYIAQSPNFTNKETNARKG